MIKAEFYKNDGVITGYKIGGHAFFDVAGKDIVCAAVSALTIAVSNQIQVDVSKAHEIIIPETIDFDLDKPLIEFPNEQEEGFIEVSFLLESEWNNALLTTLLNGLLDIEEEHPNNLKVVIDDGV